MYDGEVRRIELEKEFFDEIVKFVSPSLVKILEAERRIGRPIGIAIETMLQRRAQATSVLYCDWRGFSKKSDSIDFIERELIPSTSNLIDGFERRSGVARQTADAILTFYPLADLEESLLCALSSGFEAVFKEMLRTGSYSNPDRYFIVTSGIAMIGNMASKSHREYTIIGAPANRSARIDELTKNIKIKDTLVGFPSLVLDENSWRILSAFANEWDFKAVDLKELGIVMRSFETEERVFLLKFSIKNVQTVNALLKLNGLTFMEIEYEKIEAT